MSVAGKKKQDCCGCNACAEICPKQCIEMRLDKKGFLYPKVDAKTCIECELCEHVCPFPAEKSMLQRPDKAIAAWAKDPTVQQRSSSGGAAYLLSRHTIEHGGVVYGCAADSLTVHHVRIDSVEDLPRLQGSKYVQSDTRGIFAQVRADLDAGLTALFIGTPCQTAGLRRFIRRNAERLYLVDLICHGVPSQKMLRDHLSPIAKGHNVERMIFRSPGSLALRLYEDGREFYCGDENADLYYSAFEAGKIFRPSCYRCGYASEKRAGDITVGDFWGFKERETLPERARNGLSVILPNTKKGHELLKSITPELNLMERPVAEAVNGNTQLRHPLQKSRTTRIFQALYPLLPFDAAVRLSELPAKIRQKI